MTRKGWILLGIVLSSGLGLISGYALRPFNNPVEAAAPSTSQPLQPASHAIPAHQSGQPTTAPSAQSPPAKQYFHLVLDDVCFKSKEEGELTVKHFEIEYKGDGFESETVKTAISLIDGQSNEPALGGIGAGAGALIGSWSNEQVLGKVGAAAGALIGHKPSNALGAGKEQPTSEADSWDSHKNRRLHQLLKQSEDLRDIEKEWERIWYVDQPSHMTPERLSVPPKPESDEPDPKAEAPPKRVHGGIQ